MMHFPIGSQRLEAIKSSIDILHIPAANQLNPEFDLQDWADIVEYLAKPVLVAGLGIQCDLSEADIELTPGTLNFVKALAKFAPAIGVRGPLTQKLLNRHGVHDVVITGCPSNFLNSSLRGRSIAGKLSEAAAGHTLRADYFPGTMSIFRNVEAHLRNLVESHDFRYVLQTNEQLFRFVDGSEDNDVYAYLDWERSELAPTATDASYHRIYRERARYFLSAASWMDSASERHIGIGMRMHGTIATIQGGSAGICVVSDARMRELVTTMGYPYVDVDDVLQSQSLADLIAKAKFNASEFDDKREHLYQNYAKLAEMVKLPIRTL